MPYSDCTAHQTHQAGQAAPKAVSIQARQNPSEGANPAWEPVTPCHHLQRQVVLVMLPQPVDAPACSPAPPPSHVLCTTLEAGCVGFPNRFRWQCPYLQRQVVLVVQPVDMTPSPQTHTYLSFISFYIYTRIRVDTLLTCSAMLFSFCLSSL